MKRSTAMFVSCLLLSSLSAHAAIKPGTHQIGLQLGAASPLSNNTIDGEYVRFGKTGPAIGANYLFQYAPNLSLGGDLNLKALGERSIRTGHGTGQVDSSAWTLLAIARGDLLPDGDIRPYALLGAGLGGAKREVRFGDPRFDRDQSSSGLAFAIAGGADLDINEKWVAGAELRYNYIRTSYSEIGTDSVRTLDLLFKVGYKF
jgi:opacity protein-like surface antigen